MAEIQYNEDNIRSLDWKEHIRLRPGMYIGKLGNGSASDDGIYILIKEILDNSIDEFVMGHGRKIEINITPEQRVQVRDYGRGIPLGKVVDCVSRINTGGKYDSKAFKKSVGLNGVGTKAVNALSDEFIVYSVRDGLKKTAVFQRGELIRDDKPVKTEERNGTFIEFLPDNFSIKTEFGEYKTELIPSDGKLVYIRTFKLNKGHYKKEQYKDFADFLRKVKSADQIKLAIVNKT